MAGRLIAHFPERLTAEQRIPDELVKTPEGNIIKLPNISASIPQLLDCIAKLQAKGYNVPDYPATPRMPRRRRSRPPTPRSLGQLSTLSSVKVCAKVTFFSSCNL